MSEPRPGNQRTDPAQFQTSLHRHLIVMMQPTEVSVQYVFSGKSNCTFSHILQKIAFFRSFLFLNFWITLSKVPASNIPDGDLQDIFPQSTRLRATAKDCAHATFPALDLV